MISHRPCGACRELVPVDQGCEHWKAQRRSLGGKRSEAARLAKQARDRARPRMADLPPEEQAIRRARNRQAAIAARERARAKVESFQAGRGDGKESGK